MRKSGNIFINLVYFSNFYTSLFPLWISILLKYVIKIYTNKKYYIFFCDDMLQKILRNYHFVFVLIIGMLFICCLVYLKNYINDCNIKMEIEKKFLKVKKYRTLTTNFIITYILPIVAFDFWKIDGILLFIIYFLVLSFLIVKNRNFDGNIILEFMGYQFYDCIDIKNNNNEYIVISNFEIKKKIPYKLKFVNQNDVAFACNK